MTTTPHPEDMPELVAQPLYDLAWKHGAMQHISFAGDELESLSFKPNEFEAFCASLAEQRTRAMREADEQAVIARFLEQTGQYVTNDASREAAVLSAFDAAVAVELPCVSVVPYNSHDICEWFAKNVRARLAALSGQSAPGKGEAEGVWPIARLTVVESADGIKTEIAKAVFYTPGLPPGEHDVYPVAGCTPLDAVIEQRDGAMALMFEERGRAELYKRVGGELATIAFNLAQYEGCMLTARDCEVLKQARERWDAAMNPGPLERMQKIDDEMGEGQGNA